MYGPIAQSVRALCYKRDGREFEPPCGQNFYPAKSGILQSPSCVCLLSHEKRDIAFTFVCLSGHFEPDELPLLLTAFTGTAAFGIEGMTLHSALSFSCGPNKKKDYQPASSEKLNTLGSRLGKLKLLIIDEVSMVGADLRYHVHKRLQDITGRSDPDSRFGDISILAVGDLYQLQPIGQNHVFGLPSDSYARLHGSPWEENFTMMQLTESMRQKHDDVFAQLLSRVRTATCTAEDIALLKTRVVSKSDSSYPAEELHVFKTNKEVDEHNTEHLKTIQTRVFDMRAIDQKEDVQTNG